MVVGLVGFNGVKFVNRQADTMSAHAPFLRVVLCGSRPFFIGVGFCRVFDLTRTFSNGVRL